MLRDWKFEAMQYRDIDREAQRKAEAELEVKWEVSMHKYRATWQYFTTNPQGGGFGSNYCGPQYIALARAIENIPSGTSYRLTINGNDRGIRVKGQ